jgi:hypothetical protein
MALTSAFPAVPVQRPGGAGTEVDRLPLLPFPG